MSLGSEETREGVAGGYEQPLERGLQGGISSRVRGTRGGEGQQQREGTACPSQLYEWAERTVAYSPLPFIRLQLYEGFKNTLSACAAVLLFLATAAFTWRLQYPTYPR